MILPFLIGATAIVLGFAFLAFIADRLEKSGEPAAVRPHNPPDRAPSQPAAGSPGSSFRKAAPPLQHHWNKQRVGL